MKILVISLLRIGDLLLHRELIERARKKYLNSEIHVLANDLSEGVTDCLPSVSKWHFFPRNYIQDILVRNIHRVEKAELAINEVIEKLNQENFNLVLNATHNRLSVLLVDRIEAKEKSGEKSRAKERNLWSLYLNEVLATRKEVPFQLIDALCASLGLEAIATTEVAEDSPVERSGICLQLTTSDQKKNWPIERWIELIKKIQNFYPEKELNILCAPNEKRSLEKFLTGLMTELNVKVKIISESFYQTSTLLAKTELLITGDTAIQHLAAQVKCPTISLFIGSADLTKTAPYAENCYILKSTQACHPCWHSQKCTRDSHACAEDIKANDVFALIQSAYSDISATAEVVKTGFKNGKLFLSYLNNPQKELQTSFEREIWSLVLGEKIALHKKGGCGVSGNFEDLS